MEKMNFGERDKNEREDLGTFTKEKPPYYIRHLFKGNLSRKREILKNILRSTADNAKTPPPMGEGVCLTDI